MADFTIKRNDLLPVLEAILKDADGNPVDLTNATACDFHMRLESTQAMKITDGSCTFDADRLTGKVSYPWTGTDTDTEGVFLGEFSVTWTGGKEQSFPSTGYINIEITEDLA
jgi:hypothetical protein